MDYKTKSDEYFSKPVIAIGGSAGSLREAVKIVEELPNDLNAVVFVAMHRAYDKDSQLEAILAKSSKLNVKTVQDGDHVDLASIHISNPGEVIGMDRNGKVTSQFDYKLEKRTKNIDELFASIAAAADGNTIGVVLSGCLQDGSEGLKKIKEMGGIALVQDPTEAEFSYMPDFAIKKNKDIDFVGSSEEIAKAIVWYAENPDLW